MKENENFIIYIIRMSRISSIFRRENKEYYERESMKDKEHVKKKIKITLNIDRK